MKRRAYNLYRDKLKSVFLQNTSFAVEYLLNEVVIKV